MSEHSHAHVPPPVNEPVRTYAPGTPERAALKTELARIASERIEIPVIIDGKAVRTGDLGRAVMPHNHRHVLADWHRATSANVNDAISAAMRASRDWSRSSYADRAAVFLKAADLLAGPWRARLNAATMLGQSKSVFQAEIDAAAELIDFWRFNAHFGEQIQKEQPLSDKGVWNQLDHRPLEGFIYAVTPFNFTSIAGNLPTAPALMGNVVVWKPSEHSMLSAFAVMKLLEAAGLPPGVINLVGGDPALVTDTVLASNDFAGLHYTGSTKVLTSIWKKIGEGIERYKTYPRIVGETGGKDFIIAHSSADPQTLSVAIARGAFEYQGQKCSAAGRVYVPRSLWPGVRDRVVSIMREMKMGDVADFRTMLGAVIHRGAFERIKGYLDLARSDPSAEIVEGGDADDSVGYFIRPALVEVRDPKHRLMTEEIFGPVANVFVYEDNDWAQTLALVDQTSSYGLTGAVFATSRVVAGEAAEALRNAAGNFYINDKPTGAVVGQQPFGGARKSGTNDKAGSILNLWRWVSPRTIKENFVPPGDFGYPHMSES
jgi:1-pyrroline-5-carboxylate dehydrogenase